MNQFPFALRVPVQTYFPSPELPMLTHGHSTLLGVALAASVAAGLTARPERANAQTSPRAGVVVDGTGPETFVLVTGMVGGVTGFHRLETLLVARGYRVIVIDPYRLSIDSADVTFTALARRVDAVLDEYHVVGAAAVGHAHGAGVLLRVAGMSPSRISALYFLDAGALAVNRGPVLSGAMRLAPLVMHLPGGRGLVRDRFVGGLRRSAGRQEWLTEDVQRAYTEPVLGAIGRVVAMAGRLASAQEPESLAVVVARVHTPITVVLGDAPHEAGAGPEELTALCPLGSLVRIERLAGVGHFPHEEAPDELLRYLIPSAAVAALARAAGGAP